MTPESIEAIPAHDILAIKQLALDLHEATTGVLETPMHSRDIERERELRTALKIKLEEAMSHLKKQVTDLEAFRSELRIAKSRQTSDEKRLESYFFQRLAEEKKGNG